MQNPRESYATKNSPYEITTVRAEGRLTQERSHEFVPIHLVNSSSHCTTATVHERLLLVCASALHLILSAL